MRGGGSAQPCRQPGRPPALRCAQQAAPGFWRSTAGSPCTRTPTLASCGGPSPTAPWRRTPRSWCTPPSRHACTWCARASASPARPKSQPNGGAIIHRRALVHWLPALLPDQPERGPASERKRKQTHFLRTPLRSLGGPGLRCTQVRVAGGVQHSVSNVNEVHEARSCALLGWLRPICASCAGCASCADAAACRRATPRRSGREMLLPRADGVGAEGGSAAAGGWSNHGRPRRKAWSL